MSLGSIFVYAGKLCNLNMKLYIDYLWRVGLYGNLPFEYVIWLLFVF